MLGGGAFKVHAVSAEHTCKLNQTHLGGQRHILELAWLQPRGVARHRTALEPTTGSTMQVNEWHRASRIVLHTHA